MKLTNTLAFGFGLTVLLSAQALAAETVSNPINEDLFFANGVQIQDVTENSEGVASVTLSGSGSLTVGNQAGGGFPRVTVLSGTSMTSTRYYAAEVFPKQSWDGQFSAPGSGRLPSRDEITFSYATNQGNLYDAVDAFVWGLSNETFSFNTPARFVFPTDEADGQRLWVAKADSDGWTVASQGDYCVVESGLCYLELTSLSGIALIKQAYESCPRSSVENGQVGSVPNCIVTCDAGYYIDVEGNECLPDDFTNSFSGEESTSGNGEVSSEDVILLEDDSAEELLALEDLSEAETEDFLAFTEEYNIDPLALIAAVPGGLKDRQSATSIRRYLEDHADLTEEELNKIAHVNKSFLARNPRTAAEQLAAQGGQVDPFARQKEDSFINYLLQMRNQFANQDQAILANSSENQGTESLVEAEETESVAAADNFHSAGGKLLPSTGPGLFMIIAIIGFILMLFGGIRRN